MNIAIVGAGFAGLSVAWHLVKEKEDLSVTLFDEKGIGAGASGVASGLLHPYPGKWGKKSWRGWEAFAKAKELLEVSSWEVPTFSEGGILRLAYEEEQKEKFSQQCREDPEIEWKTREECQKILFSEGGEKRDFLGGVWIPRGIHVDAKAHLEGLWRACRERGVTLEIEKVDSLEDLEGYSHVIFAVGFGIQSFPWSKAWPLQYIKGQNVHCKAPRDVPNVLYRGYVARSVDPASSGRREVTLGSTYEHTFTGGEPDGMGREKILHNIEKVFADVRSWDILGSGAGVRVSMRHRPFPLIAQVRENTWVITAMGSRGLLYHGLCGEMIARAVLLKEKVPEEIYEGEN